MLEFLKKFFGYVYDENGNFVPYFDNLGRGAFSDWRHFAWIIIIILISVIMYNIFKKYKHAGKITVTILLISLLSVRLINQIVRACIGAENPAWRAFPFHLCTIMTFLLPLTYLFKWNKIKTPIYLLSMMGGIITIIIGDYFNDKFMTFSTLEGITAHNILLIVPIFLIAIGEFKLEYKKIWQVFVMMIILLGWAFLANDVFFKDMGTNYMYLKKNGLPGNIGGDHYFLIYILIFVVLINIIYLSPIIYNKIKTKFIKESN